ncbi:1-acyl-sn-glycerol-3-phosphate acyltransferase [Silicimonas algicola]|uniref:Lyso-ornithine lipid acyltransferase n=2 Tax=Silicimonas algicola TaxID=1826607 RepID=A0A316GBS2_9RHOB|nr:1-acyl-sn-glycerol-3-phosphate acyltransferase [Silicimonas algicola]PWK57456.1 lyso-ornithine lipid acyltransferase [Silicimonas algicola]
MRAVLRGLPLGLVVFGGLAALLVVRLVERPLHGEARPWTPWITVGVCRSALRILGLGRVSRGRPMPHPGAIVANHTSWLDIFTLNAGGPIYFVSKAEVADWPGIGWLARATGTVFVRRDPREAHVQKTMFERRLGAGHRLLFFPEGTSTDGTQVLPFKPTLFAALYSGNTPDDLWVQPVTVVYRPPYGESADFYGWWGDMDFGPHLVKILAARRQGRVEIDWHDAVRVADYPGRKALAAATEARVREAHGAALS